MNTRAVFAIPGDIDSPTGGYAYDRQVLRLLADYDVAVEHVELAGSYPFPDLVALNTARTSFAAYGSETVFLIDGLAYGVMPVGAIESIPGPIIALVHHPLAYETGLSDELRAALKGSEQAALVKADHIVATGDITVDLLVEHYSVQQDRITLAHPGTEERARARGTDTPVQLLAVGAISPRKGYTHLVDALSTLKETDWRLSIVGSLEHDPAEAERIKRAIEAAGIGDHIEMLGTLDDDALNAAFDRADVFVLSSLFEGFGMVLTEALSRGLPIVTTRVGAADNLVPDDAALKVPAGDVEALRSTLRTIAVDADLRQRLSVASWQAARALPRWNDTARIIAGVIKELQP